MGKRPLSARLILLLLFSWLNALPCPGLASDPAGPRPSILAGTWYPENPKELVRVIEEVLLRAEAPPPQGELRALLVPHAGYMYSGQVAAFAYKLLRGREIDTVVMIGPSHRFGFNGISVNLQPGYRTPLGTVQVDRDLAEEIINSSPDIGWVPRAHAREHSLEIQLPFLQTVLGNFRIIPILMGRQDLAACRELAGSLVKVLGPARRTLILASTDLSHFHAAGRAESLDGEFIRHVRNFDPEGLSRALDSGSCEACGGGPAVAAMMAARELGAGRALLLNYSHSGKVTGELGQVVGYVSAAFVKTD